MRYQRPELTVDFSHPVQFEVRGVVMRKAQGVEVNEWIRKTDQTAALKPPYMHTRDRDQGVRIGFVAGKGVVLAALEPKMSNRNLLCVRTRVGWAY